MNEPGCTNIYHVLFLGYVSWGLLGREILDLISDCELLRDVLSTRNRLAVLSSRREMPEGSAWQGNTALWGEPRVFGLMENAAGLG